MFPLENEQLGKDGRAILKSFSFSSSSSKIFDYEDENDYEEEK